MLGSRVVTAIVLTSYLACRPARVCSETSTLIAVPTSSRLLDSSRGVLLWSNESEFFSSKEDQPEPRTLLADAGVDRALIVNQDPLTVLASTSMTGSGSEVVQLLELSEVSRVLGPSSRSSDFGGTDGFLLWSDVISGSDSHPPGRARSGDEAPLEVVLSSRFSLAAAGSDLYVAELRATTPSASVVRLSAIDRSFNRTELAAWPVSLVNARISLGVLGESFVVVVSNPQAQAAWIIDEGRVEALRFQSAQAAWLSHDLSCSSTVCWLVAATLDSSWAAAITGDNVSELSLEGGSEILVTSSAETSATIHRKALDGSVVRHVATCK